MSLLVSIMRKKELRHAKANAEFQLMLISSAISKAKNSANDLLMVGKNDYDADSVVARKLQERQAKLKALEEKLEDQKQALELQIKECTTEIQSCDQLIQESITTFFSYGGGR